VERLLVSAGTGMPSKEKFMAVCPVLK
jgi:hypothetical protein